MDKDKQTPEQIKCEHDEIQERYCLNCNKILSQDDEIQKLEAEVERLKKALKIIEDNANAML